MRILITGVTGFVGSELVRACHQRGHSVNYLSTRKNKIVSQPNFQGFLWNPSKGEIDKECLKGVGAIVNLAGASIFKKWTKKNKKEILDSRVDSANLLFKTLKEQDHQVVQVIAASAIGIYPSSYQKLYFEDEKMIDDSFLGKVVVEWEAANNQFQELGIKTALIRTGLVMGNEGGALPKIQRPVSYNLGAELGSGRQWQSWIHIQDLVNIYLFVLEKGLEGAFNAVAPNPVSHKEMIREIAGSMGKKIWLPRVPAFFLRMVMGERARLLTSSQLVASKKIEEAGYDFLFPNFARTLKDLKNKRAGS